MKGMRMKMVTVAMAALVVVVSFGHASADEIVRSIEDALRQYKSGEYSAAVGSLDYAAQLIRQKKGGKLQSLLPKALPGWRVSDSNAQAVGAAMFGGGVSAERQYQKGSSIVTVTIVTDSPMLQSMMMMFSNPMFATSDGGRLETIGGQRAIVKYGSSDREGEITIVVANRFLVTVSGEGVSKKDLIDYAKGIDYKKLAALP